MDGNFHFNLKWKKTDPDDVALTQGAGFFVHADDVATYLPKAGKGAKEKEVVPHHSRTLKACAQ